MIVVVDLPWPPPELSPNARKHWLAMAKAKKRYRTNCWIVTLQQRDSKPLEGKGPWKLTLEFHPPPRSGAQRGDDDNLVARMKAGLDGMCDALQIDDTQLRLQAPVRGAWSKEGSVRATIQSVSK